MKSIVFILVSFLSWSASAVTDITLAPGSQVRISAGETMNVICSGSSSGVSENCECKILARGESTCTSGYFCWSVNYKGIVLASGQEYENAAVVLKRCRDSLAALQNNGTCVK